MARSARTVRGADLRAVAAVLAGALLAGCGALSDDAAAPAPGPTATIPAEPTTTPTPTPDAPPEEATVRAAGTAVAVGDRTVLHAAASDGTTVTTAPDGDVTVVTVDAAPHSSVEVRLAAPVDATITVRDDGSVAVVGPDGAFVGGAARPVTVAGTVPVRVTTTGGVVRATADDGDLLLRVGGAALAGAVWGDREGGRSLAVSPTAWARTAGQAGEVGVWTELVAAVPEADTAVMRDQLTCHVLGAPDKETWNLEPWRPDVGLFAVLAAACNPE